MVVFIRQKRVWVLLLALWSHNIQTHADEWQESGTIEALVKTYVTQNIELRPDETLEVRFNQLDPNSKLLSCSKKIDISFAQGSTPMQANAVVLKCMEPSSWNLIVPISIQIYTKVIVAARNLAAGDIITEEDIVYEAQDKNRLFDGYFKNADEIIGLAATRSITAGARFTKKNIKPVALVKRNRPVTLELRHGTIQVDMVGIAKSDGYLDQAVKILNPSSKKIVDAIVIGKDRAKIIT